MGVRINVPILVDTSLIVDMLLSCDECDLIIFVSFVGLNILNLVSKLNYLINMLIEVLT